MFCWWELNPNVRSERRAADFKRESEEFYELVADIIWKIVS